MKERTLQFIQSASSLVATDRPSEQDFCSLALEIFAWQFERVAPYRRFCEARGVRPGDVHQVADIPALPSDAFKRPLVARPSGNRALFFESSGTTQGPDTRSQHWLGDDETYRTSAMTWFSRMVLPDTPGPLRTLVLGPTAATHPHSSLGCMFSWCLDEFGEESLSVFDTDGNIDLDRAVSFLSDAARGSTPVLILAISSGLTRLFDALRSRGLALRLPADSRIVDTGGPKGGPSLSSKGILKAAWKRLHVPAWSCVNEYGMTEMLSQFYDDALLSRVDGSLIQRSKVGPPWCQTRVLDPVDLSEKPDGEIGLLAHFDLSNWESVSALLTLDCGRRAGRGFEITGRAPLAEARGCSQLIAIAEETADFS
ncbi:MAG: hypothetical protein ACI8TX_001607 [Hyphomicrobiaceae bacterium]|jgi:hypothetical protein